jgi:hypothetical protein
MHNTTSSEVEYIIEKKRYEIMSGGFVMLQSSYSFLEYYINTES